MFMMLHNKSYLVGHTKPSYSAVDHMLFWTNDNPINIGYLNKSEI